MFMVGALLRFGSVAAWVFQIIACMGQYCLLEQSSCCLGCDSRPKSNSSLNEPLKGKSSHYWSASKANMSDDFWTTSTCDMDNTVVQSRGSISSTSTLTQIHDIYDASSSTKPTEFVNHGFLLWNQTRQKWVGDKRPEKKTDQLLEPKISWNATYENMLSSNKPFREPIPLGEMVDFLVDIWEQEGMYD